ncbi:MAG: hypothetical protein U0703_13335 [Anaerolineae bacterium]
MRRLLLALMLLLICTAVYAQDGGLDATTTADASLRSGPGTDWRRIAVLPTGTNIRLDGQAPGGSCAASPRTNEQGQAGDFAPQPERRPDRRPAVQMG